MLIIDVELLGGRYAATEYNDRGRAEWPPHPARFFSALVAALHENAPVDPLERDALLWLERQPPPSLDVDMSVGEEVGRRRVLEVYVPVNDISLVGDIERPLRDAQEALELLNAKPDTGGKELSKQKKLVEREREKLAAALAAQQRADSNPSATELKKASALLPDRRTRQVRTFPIVFPSCPRFSFVWAEGVPTSLRAAFDRLCHRVTRLGHSSSLVHCSIVERKVTVTLAPDPDGRHVLRTVGPGQLARLEAGFQRHQGIENRVLSALPQRYDDPRLKRQDSSLACSVFSNEWILFERVGGARPLSSRGTDLSRALRDALLEQQGSAIAPDWLSGHREDGTPVNKPHVAFVALPFVGREHADSSIQGCAVVMPRELPGLERESLLRLIARWERERQVDDDGTVELAGGTLPSMRFRRVDVPTKSSLRPATWCRPARHFSSATPIALDRNPGNLRSNLRGTAHKASIEAQRSVADACEHIGLPRPIFVEVSLAPLLQGAQPVQAFLPWPGRRGRTPRVRVHADIRFAEPVRGPLLLGAGRFFGLGLCLPHAEN